MKIQSSIRSVTRFSRILAIAALGSGFLPAAAFAAAILTGPDPNIGSYGTGVGVYAGAGSAYDPASLASVSNPLSGFDNNFGNSQTTASASIIDPSIICSNCAISASASTDLATGTMRLYANSVFSNTGAQAALLDTILPQATGMEHFSITINGIGANGINNTTPFAFFQVQSFQNGYLLPSQQISYIPEGGPLADNCFSTDRSTVNCTYGFDVNLTQNDPTEIQLWMNINASPVNALCTGTACDSYWDFSHTIGLTATGVDFTSASGVFLTQVVPVPAAVWLFGSGLLGLIGFARRKSI